MNARARMATLIFGLGLFGVGGCLLPARSKQIEVEPIGKIAVGDDAVDRFVGALRLKTISYGEPEKFDPKPFLEFHDYVAKAYPNVHKNLNLRKVNEYSLVYEWRGSDPSLKPALLMAHFDVVPVVAEDWSRDPFGAEIADGYIWARGTLDDKVNVIALFEAAEHLTSRGYQPKRTIYFSFGHDEEIGGTNGAKAIAAIFADDDIEFEFVMDEGLAVLEGLVPGVAGRVALIGIAEKGYVSLELTVHAEGGHSSQPPPQTAIGILSSALAQLEKRQVPGSLRGPSGEMFAWLAPHMSYGMQLVFNNKWLFNHMIKTQLAAAPSSNALLRTTTAETIFRAGVKDNILPTEARAVVNFRIHPNDTIESVKRHVARVIGDDRVEIADYGKEPSEPSPESSTDSAGFRLIQQTIGEVFPNAIVAPGLVVGATDSRHFGAISDDVYRFMPVVLGSEDLSGIHGTDERISVENYKGAVAFYIRFLENTGG